MEAGQRKRWSDRKVEGLEYSMSRFLLYIGVANNSGIDWSETAEVFRDRILEFLEEWGMDDLREGIEVLHTFAPDDFQSELNSLHGNAFSVEPRLTQTAWFRPQNRSEDVDGLYLVGADTHPDAGVPGVLLSAEATYGCIADDLGLPPQWQDDGRGQVKLPGKPHPATPLAVP